MILGTTKFKRKFNISIIQVIIFKLVNSKNLKSQDHLSQFIKQFTRMERLTLPFGGHTQIVLHAPEL